MDRTAHADLLVEHVAEKTGLPLPMVWELLPKFRRKVLSRAELSEIAGFHKITEDKLGRARAAYSNELIRLGVSREDIDWSDPETVAVVVAKKTACGLPAVLKLEPLFKHHIPAEAKVLLKRLREIADETEQFESTVKAIWKAFDAELDRRNLVRSNGGDYFTDGEPGGTHILYGEEYRTFGKRLVVDRNDDPKFEVDDPLLALTVPQVARWVKIITDEIEGGHRGFVSPEVESQHTTRWCDMRVALRDTFRDSDEGPSELERFRNALKEISMCLYSVPQIRLIEIAQAALDGKDWNEPTGPAS